MKLLTASLLSWKTTILALLQFSLLVITAVINCIDADPTTAADWNKVVAGAIVLLNSLGLFIARDSDKSSQDSGIRPASRLGVLALLCLLPATCFGQTKLSVEPTAGNLMGYVSSQEPGGWLVFGPNFSPVIATPSEDHKSVRFEGKSGTYMVVFFVMKDSIPITTQQPVTLGGTEPNPPDPPVVGGKRQVLFLFDLKSLETLPEGQQDVLSSLLYRDWMQAQGHVFLGMADPVRLEAGSVPERYQAWMAAWKKSGVGLPAMGTAALTGGDITFVKLPETLEAAKASLKVGASK